MYISKLFTSSLLLKIIFAIALFILIFISGISYKHTLSVNDSMDQVVHTHETNLELEQMLSYIKDAEAGQRGFIITGDSIFLVPYLSARDKVNHSFDIIKQQTEGYPEQQKNLDSLYHLINLRFTLLTIVLRESQNEKVVKSRFDEVMVLGNQKMDLIRTQVDRMVALELQYLKERQAKYDQKIAVTPFIILMMMMFALLVFGFSFWKINRDLHKQEEKNAKLLIIAESIRHAEGIGAFSSWQWDFETSRISFSDNQFLMLGLEPNSINLTIEKFLEFVHPGDKQLIREAARQVVLGIDYPAVTYRIIRRDGEIRHFKSLSKLIADPGGRKTLIGINSDVTEQVLNSLSLEDRNRELEQSNKELASFNHVASHDLQEPLRIVQIYISRFDEKEIAALSDKARGYLVKMKMAVTRMRTLIDALLLFSRTNKIEKVFEWSDLNLLLENSKLDLAQLIAEKNAVIQSDELPTLNVVPFQIQQLFTNLIGNSLKYSRENVTPLIKVGCEKVNARDFPELRAPLSAEYFKIYISDNGLGFEQQYAEKMFTIFFRLHHDTEYEGAGIGLTICKKIVDIHSGTIIAKGEPGVGATFSIFLPVLD